MSDKAIDELREIAQALSGALQIAVKETDLLRRQVDEKEQQVEALIELISENPCLANCQAAAGCCREESDLCAIELRLWSLEQAKNGGGGE